MLTFVGFQVTFLVQHILGLEGMPRRVADLPGRRRLRHPEPRLVHRRLPPRHLDRARSSGTSGARGATASRRATTRGTARPSSGGRRRRPSPENWDRPLPPIRSERPVWDVNHPDARASTDGEPARARRHAPAALPAPRSRIYGTFFGLLIVGAFGYAIWSSWEAAGTVLLFLVGWSLRHRGRLPRLPRAPRPARSP